MRISAVALAVGLVGAFFASSDGRATSGPGCFRIVNVDGNDVLNIRTGPSASDKLSGTMSPRDHGIIHDEGDCTPTSSPQRQRWCPIIHYHGAGTTIGYVKRKFLKDSDCP